MATDREIFDALSVVIKTDIPAFETRWKLRVWAEVAVASILWTFNPKYLTHYVTTMYPHVDFPREDHRNEAGAWKILAHEYVHLWDRKRLGWCFVGLYGFPQILAPLALLAIVGIWWKWALLALLFLLCAVPWPAPGRVWAELRGYTMSMAVNFWRYGEIADANIDWIEPQFTGWAYFKMSWNRPERMKTRLRAQVAMIRSGKILEGPENRPFREMKTILERLEVSRG